MIPILYGSQTGTGIHLAGMLARKIGSEAIVLPIDGFDITKLFDLEYVIFICSTHGDGQCPFNMVRFWTAIIADIPAVLSFKYAVLGLGDTSYQKYNWCAKMLYNRLKQLGATPFLKVFANTQDQGGVYDGYYKFEQELLDHFQAHNIILPCNTVVVQGTGEGSVNYAPESLKISAKLYRATVVSHKLVSNPNYEKKVVEILFDIPEYREFLPGDCLGIHPVNRSDALEGFGYSEAEKSHLLKTVDLNAVPHQTSFHQLSELVEDCEKRDKLKEMATEYDLYHSYAVLARRNILEILKEFDIRPPFDYMASLAEIYPRYYSFSMVDEKYYSILVGVVDYKTYMADRRVGLCSEYLKILTGSLEVEIIPSRLYMEGKNLLFFATGTGITLPRSVLHFFKDKNVRVYYGFRHYANDFLCKDEFGACKLFCAASIDDGKRIMEVYRENPVDNIDDWTVFVSGNAGVNKNICKLLCDVHGKNVAFQSETW